MLNRIIAVDQGSEEWRQLRKGRPNSSRFSDFITKSLNYSESDTALNYKYELVAENILNRPMGNTKYVSEAMKHGIKYENEAASRLKDKLKTDLLPGGYCINRYAGCSPDRIVAGKDEIVEIKCPQPGTQCRYLDDLLGDAYEIQVQAQLWITGADMCHFWSYWPEWENLPPVYVRRIPNRIAINHIAGHAQRFWEEIKDAERRLIENGAVPIAGSNR